MVREPALEGGVNLHLGRLSGAFLGEFFKPPQGGSENGRFSACTKPAPRRGFYIRGDTRGFRGLISLGHDKTQGKSFEMIEVFEVINYIVNLEMTHI
jgi:hypothetical protein